MRSPSDHALVNRSGSRRHLCNQNVVGTGPRSLTDFNRVFYRVNRVYGRFHKAPLITPNILTFVERWLRMVIGYFPTSWHQERGFRPTTKRLTSVRTGYQVCTRWRVRQPHQRPWDDARCARMRRWERLRRRLDCWLALASGSSLVAASWSTVGRGAALSSSSRPAVAGPSWKEAISGSGPGRFPGLVNFFFVVFLPSQLSRVVPPCSASGQSPGIALFDSRNSDCKTHFKEESPMQHTRRTDVARGNTPAAKVSQSIIRNIPLADDPRLPAARRRAGFLGWSKGLMLTGIHGAPGGSGVSGRCGVALKRLN